MDAFVVIVAVLICMSPMLAIGFFLYMLANGIEQEGKRLSGWAHDASQETITKTKAEIYQLQADKIPQAEKDRAYKELCDVLDFKPVNSEEASQTTSELKE